MKKKKKSKDGGGERPMNLHNVTILIESSTPVSGVFWRDTCVAPRERKAKLKSRFPTSHGEGQLKS